MNKLCAVKACVKVYTYRNAYPQINAQIAYLYIKHLCRGGTALAPCVTTWCRRSQRHAMAEMMVVSEMVEAWSRAEPTRKCGQLAVEKIAENCGKLRKTAKENGL